MSPDKGLLSSVVKVVPHQEVEELGGLGSDGAQFGVTAFQNLVAQSSTHVSSAFVERRGELDGTRKPVNHRKVRAPFSSRWKRRTYDNQFQARPTCGPCAACGPGQL